MSNHMRRLICKRKNRWLLSRPLFRPSCSCCGRPELPEAPLRFSKLLQRDLCQHCWHCDDILSLIVAQGLDHLELFLEV